ncbi:hypothetical protein HispidOSU_013387, partial [Sigmodon hispidus]
VMDSLQQLLDSQREIPVQGATSSMSFSIKDRDPVEVFEIYSEGAERGDRHTP